MRLVENAQGKTSLEGLFVALGFCLFAIVLVFYGAKDWFPPVASRHGPGIDRMLIYLMIVTGSMILIGHLVLGYFIFRFSGQKQVTHRLAGAKTEKRWSVVLGIVMALAAEGGVLVLGMPVWQEFYGMAAPSDAVKLEVLPPDVAVYEVVTHVEEGEAELWAVIEQTLVPCQAPRKG